MFRVPVDGFAAFRRGFHLFPTGVRGVTDAGLKPRPIRTAAVLGGGLMGSGIATALALAGVDVLLKEVNQQFLD
ncbi:hypothetical protein MNEG_15410, partial [Monoraphidium neglectum]